MLELRNKNATLLEETAILLAQAEGTLADTQELIKTDQSLALKQKEANVKTVLAGLRTQIRRLKFSISVADMSLNYRGTLKPDTLLGAIQNDVRVITASSDEVPFPVVVKPTRGQKISIATHLKALEPEVAEYLREQLVACAERGVELTIRAPAQARSEEGMVLSLPEDIQKELIAYSLKKGQKPPPMEHLAWQWLIVSHNQVCEKEGKIHLHRALRRGWADPLNKGVSRRRNKIQDENAKLKRQLEVMAKFMVDQGLSASELPPEILEEESKFEAEHLDSSSDDEEAEGPLSTTYLPLPKYAFLGERKCDLAPSIRFFEELEGKTARISVFRTQGTWAVYVEDSQYDIPVTLDLETGIIQESKSTAASSTPVPEGTPKKAVPSQATPKVKKAAKATKAATGKPVADTPLANPLKVKGLPRSASLTKEQHQDLKKFFKIEDIRKSDEEWAAMSNAEKSAFRRSQSLPKWAIQAVVANPKNLVRILKGELTASNFRAVDYPVQPAKKDRKPANPKRGRRGRSASVPREKSRGRGRSRRRGKSEETPFALLLRSLLGMIKSGG